MTDRRGVVLVVLAACAWGTWSLYLRPTGLSGLWTGTIVFAFMALYSLPLLRFDAAPRWDRAAVSMLAAFAALDALNVATFFGAMSVTSVAIAVLTHSLGPVFVALLAPVVEKRRVPHAIPAALVSLAGLALVLRPWEAPGDDVLAGAALGSASAVAYAGNVFLTRRLVPKIGPARAMGMHAAGAALLLLPIAWLEPASISMGDVALLATGAAIGGAFGGVAFTIGLVRIGSSRAAVLAFVEPLVACLVGWLVWGEPLGALAIAGAALVVGAGAVVARGAAETVRSPQAEIA